MASVDGKERRGFASMDRALQRRIASMGGKAAHEKGTAHEWDTDEAREAGRKGGEGNRRRHQASSVPRTSPVTEPVAEE